jgi:hypothetical protein
MAYYPLPDQDIPDTTYRSQGVHKNRDSSAKMSIDATDREGFTDAQRAEMRAAADEAAQPAEVAPEAPSAIMVDEPVIKAQKDVSQETLKAGHASSDKLAQRVEPGRYELIAGPGSGRDSGWGKEGTQSNPAQDTSMKDQGMGGMMGGMGGMMGGGGGGGGGGEGGGGMMSGLPAQIGKDIASKDDSIDRANNEMFLDDTDIEAHQALGEKLQGR